MYFMRTNLCNYDAPYQFFHSIYAGRHINNHRHHSQAQHQSQVNLCGSRGTGGVVTFGTSTFLNLFDLEEDEDNASSGDDDESMEEEGP